MDFRVRALACVASIFLCVGGRLQAIDQGWVSQSIPTTETLRAVHFVSAEVGWAVGYNGTILHTTNGGENWVPQTSGTVERLVAVRFLDANNGWATAGRLVLRSTNGGQNWVSVNADPSAFKFRNSLFAVSASQAWAPANSSGLPNASRWFSRYTVQQDNSVLEEDFNVLESGAVFFDMFFPAPDSGWAVGLSGQIFKITNATSSNPTFTQQTSGISTRLNAVFMLDSETGWIAGDNGTILHTTNGGATWMSQPSGIETHLKDIHFVDMLNGWAVGESGVILMTQDGGTSWMSQGSGVSTTLWSVDFVNPGYIAGGDFTGGANGVLLKLGQETGGEMFTLNFAQFGDGAVPGAFLNSRILLSNLDPDNPASVTLEIRDNDGNPITVDLNGSEVAGMLEAAIPAGGIEEFATDGAGSLQAGSVQVTSDRDLSGVLLFGGSVGFAGVASSVPLRRMHAPVQTGPGSNSGLALMDLADGQTIELELFDSQGTLIAEASVLLAARGHLAAFLAELAWDTPPDFSEFTGTLIASGPEDFAATIILVNPGQFATLPVRMLE